MRLAPKNLLIPALCALPMWASAQSGNVLLSDRSKLSINGKSNVNDFRCIAKHEFSRDSLQYSYQYQDQSIQVDRLLLSLEVDEFDCGKRAINRDFKNTLQYKEHPYIRIRLNEILVQQDKDLIPYAAKVTIEIADVKKDYTVALNSFTQTKDEIEVTGNKVLYMSDFGLKAPSPLFGLIKVSDELDIVFDLIVKLDQQLD